MKNEIEKLKRNMKELLKNLHLEKGKKLDDDMLNLVLKYYSSEKEKLSEIEEKKIKEIYTFHLQKEAENVIKKFDFEREKIEKIVSAFSFSEKTEILSEYPFEKDLKIFPNVKEIFLFITEGVKSNYEKIKLEIEKNEKIKITGIQIEGSDFNEIYTELKKLFSKGKISSRNTILDTTLGMKIFGLVFYRISAERGIKSVNWNEKNFKNYSGFSNGNLKIEQGSSRIDLTTKFSIMKEPLQEARINYDIINKNIEKNNYEAVSGFYKMIGIEDLSFFFYELSQVFNIDKMMSQSSEEFFENLEIMLKKMFEYLEYGDENKKRLKEAIVYFLTLVYYNEDNYCDENGLTKNHLEWLNLKNNVFNIQEKDLEKYLSDFIFDEVNQKFYKNKYLQYLKLKYSILGNKPQFYIDEIKEEIIGEEFLIKQNEKEFSLCEDLEKIHSMMFESYEEEYESSLLTKVELKNYLKEDFDVKKLVFKNDVLIIPREDLDRGYLKIDFKTDKKLKNMRRGYVKYEPIYELLDNIEKSRYLSSEKVKEIIQNNSNSPVTKVYRDLKEVVKEINECIILKMKEENIEVDEFIKTDSSHEKYSIYISNKY